MMAQRGEYFSEMAVRGDIKVLTLFSRDVDGGFNSEAKFNCAFKMEKRQSESVLKEHFN